MRPDPQTLSPARRRTLGLALALLTTAAVTLSGCGGSGVEETPAISGGNPADITVPTLPTTTTAAPTETTVAGGATTSPTTTARG